MAEKTEQNWYPQKTSKNEAQGVPELTQNGSEFIEKLSEIEKSGPKTENWVVNFLMIFWVAKRLVPEAIPISE